MIGGIASAIVIYFALCTGTINLTESVEGEKFTITMTNWCPNGSPEVDSEYAWYRGMTFLGYEPGPTTIGEHEIPWPSEATCVDITAWAGPCNGWFMIHGTMYVCTRQDSDELHVERYGK